MNEAEFKSPKPDEELLFFRLMAREELGRLPEIRLDLFQLFDPKELAKYFTDTEMHRLDANELDANEGEAK